MAYYAEAAVSSHESTGRLCVCVCISACLFWCMSLLCIHLYACMFTTTASVCVCLCVCMCILVLSAKPPLAPPAELKIGGDRWIDEIFSCRMFRRTTDALFC